MNNVQLIGRLTKDPEIRYTQSQTAVVSFTLAVDRRFKKDGGQTADFISCKAWNKTAEFVSKYFTKGKRMALTGRIETGSYEGKNGKVYTTEVIADNVEFVDSKEEPKEERPEPAPDDWLPVPENIQEEIPFA